MIFLEQMLQIFSNKKDFTGILGNPVANRLGLHVFRIVLGHLVSFIRKAPFCLLERDLQKTFAENGVLVLENFLDEAAYVRVKGEVYQQIQALPPAPANTTQGFGPKLIHEQGFDRYDGDTLNRFAPISKNSDTMAFLLKNPRLSRLTLALFGLINRPEKYFIYELRHGDESRNPDIQKRLHKDTFHPTYKLWYFLDEVTDASGPFAYALGSHRLSLDSLRWEYQMSCAVASDENHPNQGGSFRASADDLQKMGLSPPCAFKLPPNTLVIADTKGFHQRCNGLEGASRISIYANFRPLAFLPFIT
jgi:hypothetical protein